MDNELAEEFELLQRLQFFGGGVVSVLIFGVLLFRYKADQDLVILFGALVVLGVVMMLTSILHS